MSDADNHDAIAQQLASLGFDDPQGAATRLVATWQAPRLQTLPEASRNRLAALVNTALPQIATVVREAGPRQPCRHARPPARLFRGDRAPLGLSVAADRIPAYAGARDPHDQRQRLGRDLPHPAPDPARRAAGRPRQRRHRGPAGPGRQPGAPAGRRPGDTERQLDILREAHHAQLFRLLAMDLAGELSVERLADHLSALADLIVHEVVQRAWLTLPRRHREVPRFAVIAYGKLGGKELGYVSDLDVIFLFDDDDQDAPGNYAKLAQRFITWMTTHTPAGILFDIDTALRPDGASGMLVSSIGAFERYQRSSAWIWEHQALTRARFCAGDAAIGARFEAIREEVLRQDRSQREPNCARKWSKCASACTMPTRVLATVST
jgi:glutamate-ammonia-ligase adenylyltransferase